MHNAVPDTDTLSIGETLVIRVPPEDMQRTWPRVIRWTSHAPAVVSVDSITGTARALAIGDMHVVATDIAMSLPCRDTWDAFIWVR